MKMIPFNKSLLLGTEVENIQSCLKSLPLHISGNGEFTKKCEKLLEERYGFEKVMLTNSCTSALEICALLLKEKVGDKIKNPEIIMPSFTFVSSANSFAKFGFKIKFIDIKPDTMNLDEELAIKAINKNTVGILAVNYGGISPDLIKLRKICNEHNLFLVEDAAQSIDAKLDGKLLGSFGDLAAFSFHETKNITSGEGGCLIVQNKDFIEHAQVIREKGSNRTKFILGLVDKYSWVGIGGHYLMPEINAAFLYVQIQKSLQVKEKRCRDWDFYKQNLQGLENKGFIEMQSIPSGYDHNAHMFWIKLKNLEQRNDILKFLKENAIIATFHYIPLHSSDAGKRYGEFLGEDNFTTKESQRLIRLPMFYDITNEELEIVVTKIKEFLR